MSHRTGSRRQVLGYATLGVGAFALNVSPALAKEQETAKDVGAVEDLMREHGVLRRALLVYSECAPRLRANSATFDASALNRTAKLFKAFGEDYHERKLEEAYIFPRIRKGGGEAARYVDILLAQHNRGREITAFILQATASGKIAKAGNEALAAALASFVRMYENHAAREDTVVFPAWKAELSASELGELGERFEDIETKQFGGDGFEKAAREIGDIERTLGLDDLAQFTAPHPPKI